MTREIALHCMKSASELESEVCEECPIYGQTGCDHCYEDALRYVIAMIEQEPCEEQSVYERAYKEGYDKGWSDGNFCGKHKQEPILDKIRAEINSLTVFHTTKDKQINLISQNAVNRIIDKYKAGDKE